MRAAHHSLVWIVVLLLDAVKAQQRTCDFNEDACPYPVEGICDAFDGGPCPSGSDCFDCDPCQAHNLDCQACVSNACYWCPSDAICISRPLGESFWSAAALIEGTQTSTCTAEADWVTHCDGEDINVFTDPLYSAQKWAYDLLNVEPVWKEGITGKGVVIRVNDPDGVAVEHLELADRFLVEASCNVYLPKDDVTNFHGTAVASLAVGGSNNGHCAVGIAPEASLSACLGPTDLTDENAAAFFLNGLETTHVSVNAWGFDACRPTAPNDNFNNRRFLQQSCPFVSQDADLNPCTVCDPILSEPE